MKKSVKFILYFVIIVFVVTLITEVQVIYFGKNAKPKKSDCIIVLGCKVYGSTPSPFLMWRLNRSLELYRKGYGDYIIVSGGKGPGENISEAKAMKNYLVYKGADSSKVIMEDKSVSTMENLSNSKKVMVDKGFKTAVIVSNKYHLKRASLMAESQGIDGSYSGVFVYPYKNREITGYIREIPAVWKYHFYQIFRIY
ncbi:YdcF family protein [Clostridium sp. BJN0013]|uniref:YdcF family protein n=1 Tax=Clostridium sp. BJN0013 TaxID=3236840 RepID=UPI0034C6204B